MIDNNVFAYHGTTINNVKSIKENGFNKGTYFALDIIDAIQVTSL